MRNGFVVTSLAFLFAAMPARAQVDARMFRYPDVSDTHITFVYAGDIWVVEKNGGTARRLSSPPGEELFPRFSPDGRRIAFSGNYDGNTDVYVIPAMGGETVRVTHHPDADRLLDWTPDGTRLLFASPRESGVRRFNQLYLVSPDGGLPQKLPAPYGEFGTLSPDGGSLAYMPKTRDFRNWKRYRGGMAPDIWLLDLESLDAQNVSSSDANDGHPMWHGKTLYFLSDRGPEQRSNIWALETVTNQMRAVTRFPDVDVTFPAIGPSNMVFQAGGRLYLLDLAMEGYRKVDVDVVTDLATLRPRSENVSELIETANISPSGKRAVFEARGEVFTVPAQHGVVRNITHTSGVAERYAAWSPDGKHIAYWSDGSGEYELTLRPADGSGEEKTLTDLGPGYRYRLFWSPDSEKLALIDETQTIRIYDLEAGKLTKVDQALFLWHGGLLDFEVGWSRDSRWLAYSRGLETTNTAIFLFDTHEGDRFRVTSGYYSDSRPVFDPEGNYLYYLSNRTLVPIYSDLDATWIYPNTTNVVAVPLRTDVASPLVPRNDEETGAERDEGSEETENEEAPKEVTIDLEGFEARAVVLPPEPGNYQSLRAVSGKVIYHRQPRTGSSSKSRPIVSYDIEEREEKIILEDASSFEVSADGKKMLVHTKEHWGIINIKPNQKIGKRPPKAAGASTRPPTMAEQKPTAPLATADLESVVDPAAEWRQMFTDVWRAYRDRFYDPGMHGLDWAGLRQQYGSLLEDAVTRWDVNFVIGELIAEVNASHTYVSGGDTETPRERQVGLLGVDWTVEDGVYRIARIVRGAPWDVDVRSPLSEPGLDVSEGDYILAVNGIPLDTGKDPYAAFEGLAEKTVALTVNRRPVSAGAREVLVKTLASEARLRNLEWVETNRQDVDEATGGRVGYIFVPDTSIRGQSELVRQFNSQMRKEGLIIDERFNSGGQLPDRFIEKMNRQMVTRLWTRYGPARSHPNVTHYGPKVMLINGWAGSGGDAFPFFFKQMKVGPLIGERTWGGLIGPAIRHGLMDGGSYTAPPARLYSPDGVWFAEGHGVDPDIPVVDDQGEMAKGRDPQLEAAIKEVLRLIEENPPKFVDPPPYEKRTATDGR